uniref:Uncharacterized protein n=1 Tax=Glossina austeni TaxID=7395 RepID=A0A1A9VD01_GLOAU
MHSLTTANSSPSLTVINIATAMMVIGRTSASTATPYTAASFIISIANHYNNRQFEAMPADFAGDNLSNSMSYLNPTLDSKIELDKRKNNLGLKFNIEMRAFDIYITLMFYTLVALDYK